MLEVGQKAPLFTEKNQKGETVSLEDFKGKR
jgi:peroxiredoxin